MGAREEQIPDGPEDTASLEGQILIAMPSMRDPRFERTVIFLCAHSEEGAMGIVVNKAANSLTLADLLEQLSIPVTSYDKLQDGDGRELMVHFGGPVETSRGFVLHSGDYESRESTLPIDEDFRLTATLDVLKEIAAGRGPERRLLALGYAGWAPGQLEEEIQANGWLHCEADPGLVFDTGIDDKYEAALNRLGVDLSLLSGDAGHA